MTQLKALSEAPVTKPKGKAASVGQKRLNAQLNHLVGEEGLELDAALEVLADTYFNADEDWPAFFTTIRWYLGPHAENRLKTLAYKG